MAWEKPTPNWVRLYLPEMLRGFYITSRHFTVNLLGFVPGLDRVIRKYVPTIQYPEVERPISDRWRGRHRLNRREDGSSKCVACFCCQTVCPAGCINIQAGESPEGESEKIPMKFEINLFECVFCGLCAEACPCDALYMDTKDMKISQYSPDKFVLTLKDLLK
jgi:NADH-quinone oxidoreductase subunit I